VSRKCWRPSASQSNKLIKIQVDVGSEQRTLVAGIAEA
jgi:tRNA-binding EMAP/Myf-like protein